LYIIFEWLIIFLLAEQNKGLLATSVDLCLGNHAGSLLASRKDPTVMTSATLQMDMSRRQQHGIRTLGAEICESFEN